MNSTKFTNINIDGSFFDDLRKLLAEMLSLASSFKKPAGGNEPEKSVPFNESAALSDLMLSNFESMLGLTVGMMKNMGSIEGGISALLKMILQAVSSFTSGGSGGGLFGSLLGSLFGLAGGPIGSIIGGVLGSGLDLSGLFGGSAMRGSLGQLPVNNFSGRNPNIINQVIIRNPVTFSKAYDVEVRNRLVRGGIDL